MPLPIPQQAQALYQDGTPIPEDKLPEAISSGNAGYAAGSEVYMSWKHPRTGATHRIKLPAEQVPTAMQQGYRPESPSETHVNNLKAFEEQHPILSAGMAVGRASADTQRALTLGIPLTTGPLAEAIAGQVAPEATKGFQEAGQVAKQLHPVAAGVGTLATLAATAPVAPGEAAVTRAAGLFETAAPRVAGFLKGVPAATATGRVLQSGVRSGLAAGVDTAGFSAGEQIMQEQQALANKELTSERLLASAGRVFEKAGEGGALGLFLGGATGGFSKVLGESGSALLNSKILGPEGLHGLKSLGMTPSELKQLGRFESKDVTTAEDMARVAADTDLAEQIMAAAPKGSEKLSEIERRVAGGMAVQEEVGKIPGAFSPIKSLEQRATIIDAAKERTGQILDEFRAALDRVAKPDTNTIKTRLNGWLDTLNNTGPEIRTAARLKEDYVDFIKKDSTFGELQDLRKRIGAYSPETISGVANKDRRALERELESAVENEIKRLNPEWHAQYMALKGQYSRLNAGAMMATRGATKAAVGAHRLSNMLSVASGAAELVSHGLGAGLAVGGATKIVGAALTGPRREALIASLYRGLKGGTDSTAIKLSNAVSSAIKGSGFAPTAERMASATSKIVSHYANATEPIRMIDTDPTVVASKVAQHVGPVAAVDPELGRTMTKTIMDDLNYLRDMQKKGVFMNAPLPMSVSAGGIGGKRLKGRMKAAATAAGTRVPVTDAARYLRYDRALWNPVGELQKWSTSGRLNPALPEVLRERRPNIQAQLAMEVMNHASKMASKGERMGYSTRVQVSQLIGAPIDSSMSRGYILNSQTIWAQNASDNPPPMVQPEAGVKAVSAGVRRRARLRRTETESLEFNSDEQQGF